MATAVVTWAMLRTWSVRFDGEEVHGLREVAPRAAHALDLGLTAETSLGADLARDARDLVGERLQLVDHRVDRLLELEDLAARVDRDLLATRSPLATAVVTCGDVAHLAGEVVGHEVHGVGEVAPRAAPRPRPRPGRRARPRVPTSRATPVTCSANARSRVGHRVDRLGERRDLALRLDRDLLRRGRRWRRRSSRRAIWRTWSVRFDAIVLTRVRQVASTCRRRRRPPPGRRARRRCRPRARRRSPARRTRAACRSSS